MRPSIAVNLAGAVLCAAAFVGAMPNCLDLQGNAMPAGAYLALSATLIFLSLQMRRRAAYFVWLVLFSLTLRLAWGLGAYHPMSTVDDYGYYRDVSLSCLAGHWAELLHTQYPWGYILYLYALARIFGASLAVPIVANALIGSATVLMVYVIACTICTERCARIAAGIYACCPGVIYWNAVTCSEIPHALFFLAALYCLLHGVHARAHDTAWLAGGGALAAAAEFIRPVSPVLLLPIVCYAIAVGGSGKGKRGKRAAVAVAAYILCLAALLAAKSFATGYTNFTASQTLGVNLAHGLNWESSGTYSDADSRNWDWKNPRETNRRGFQLARERLSYLWKKGLLLALVVKKFPIIWSTEETAYDANFQESDSKPWLTRYRDDFRAIGQYFYALLLVLAALGFLLRCRSGSLALLSGIMIAFALLHLVIEVDDRYHFPMLPIMAISAAAVSPQRRRELGV